MFRKLFDILFLLAVLTIPACTLFQGYRNAQKMSPPVVDMSEAKLIWQDSTK